MQTYHCTTVPLTAPFRYITTRLPFVERALKPAQVAPSVFPDLVCRQLFPADGSLWSFHGTILSGGFWPGVALWAGRYVTYFEIGSAKRS